MAEAGTRRTGGRPATHAGTAVRTAGRTADGLVGFRHRTIGRNRAESGMAAKPRRLGNRAGRRRPAPSPTPAAPILPVIESRPDLPCSHGRESAPDPKSLALESWIIRFDQLDCEKMEKIQISKFKANCLAVLDRVGKTRKPVLVTRFGKPVAQIVPPPRPDRREGWLGCMRDRGRIVGDIVGPAAEASEWEVLESEPEIR